MQLKKRFLGQIFRFRHVPDHAQAKRVDSSFMERIELRKGVVVAGLSAREHIRIRGS